jgi:hypothetical protein
MKITSQIFNTVTINNKANNTLFTANNVTVQDALNGYRAQYAMLSDELLIDQIQEIVTY